MLVSGGRVCIDRLTNETWKQPALLRTCSQIRNEAKAIYYLENKFRFRALDFDSSALTAWYQHGKAFWNKPLALNNITRSGTGRPVWANVELRAKRIHEKRAFWIHAQSTPTAAVVAAATEMAADLRVMRATWAERVRLLEVYRKGVEAGNPSWR